MSKKKKILFVNGHLNVGGIEKSLTDILRHIDYNKYDVDLLLLEETGDYIDELPESVNILLKSLKNTYGSFWGCISKCIQKRDWFSLKMRLVFLLMKLFGQNKVKLVENMLTKKKNYDIAVGFRPGICTQLVAYAIHAEKKIAWWHHGEFNVSVSEYEEQLKNCDILVSVSDSCARMIADNIPEISNKIVVVPNMIDSELLEKKSGNFSPYADDIIQLVTVGRLSQEKHMENVIYAARQLKEDGHSFKWHIVGDGVLRDDLERIRQKENVCDCVIFEGAKKNPYPYIKNADLYVHPSYVESQGITILEAMSLHIPCVVTKSRGSCEFIEDGDNGILVNQGWKALAAGVKQLLENRELYKKREVKTGCPMQFQASKVLEKIYRVFEKV